MYKKMYSMTIYLLPKNDKAISILMVLLTVFFVSCGKSPDLSRLKEGCYYVANDKDRGVVLLVDEVT